MKTSNVIYFYLLLIGSTALAATHYVDINNATPSSPYTSWGTAATNIQDAIDVAVAAETVLVNDGVYDSGTTIISNMPNRIAITKAITVESVNGPTNTYIVGEGPIGSNAVRCVYMTADSILSGFTITNGHTMTSGDYLNNQCGGGVFVPYDGNTIISNCILSGNIVQADGGGVYNEGDLILNNCTLIDNTSTNYGSGGGIYNYGWLELNNCTLSKNLGYQGGGIVNFWAILTLNNCTLSGNTANYYGGGIYNYGDDYCSVSLNNCTLSGNAARYGGGGIMNGYGIIIANNCTIRGNTAGTSGGGANSSILNNCTISGNSASDKGGGAYACWATNCTFVGKSANDGGGMCGDYSGLYAYNCIFKGNYATNSYNDFDRVAEIKYSCSTQLVHGVDGNITNTPLFVGEGNYHLAPSSPCINAGSNGYVSVATDLEGNPRIVGQTVDMGAYEFGFEYITDFSLVPSGMQLQWMPVSGMYSVIKYSTNLVEMPFTDLTAPIPYPMKSYLDVVHGAESECFYKVEIQP